MHGAMRLSDGLTMSWTQYLGNQIQGLETEVCHRYSLFTSLIRQFADGAKASLSSTTAVYVKGLGLVDGSSQCAAIRKRE